MKVKLKTAIGVARFTLKKYSPEILLGVGIVGVGASTVLACRATLKCTEILEVHQESMDDVDRALMIGSGDDDGNVTKYTPDDAGKDRRLIMVNTSVNFVKLYGPSVTLMMASVGCILAAHHIMSKRNAALMAAYKLVEEAFTQYRERVVNELGADKDSHFMYGTETVEETDTVIGEDGRKKKVKTQKEELVPGAKLSGFARMFEEDKPDNFGSWDGSTQWSPVHDYNLSFLETKESYFNDRLTAKGFVTVNDVYEQLGFPPTEAGMVCGWRDKADNGDGYISFRPRGIDGNWATGKDGDAIILDFNIDGVIFDQNYARKELK